MTRNPVKIVDHVVAAALLYAARNRLNAHRHIAGELRRTAEEYDARADDLLRAMKETVGC